MFATKWQMPVPRDANGDKRNDVIGVSRQSLDIERKLVSMLADIIDGANIIIVSYVYGRDKR